MSIKVSQSEWEFEELNIERLLDEDSQILKPRDYQMQILSQASKMNTIGFLDTGTGKTYIAILLMKQLFKEGLEINRLSKKGYGKGSLRMEKPRKGRVEYRL